MFSHVQHRLLRNNLIFLGSILLIFSTVVYLLFSQNIYAQLDERLVLLARAVALSVEVENGQLQFAESIYLGMKEKQIALPDGAVVQWLDSTGKILRSRGNLPLQALPVKTNTFHSQDKPERVRVYSLLVKESPQEQPTGYVRVALSLAPSEQTLNRLLLGLGVGVSLTLALGTLGSFWLTQQSMKPIEEGYERLKQFTADASHELRSPLTAIKTNAAIALEHQEQLSPQDIHNAFAQIEDCADQMTYLVSDLLLLAREDSSQPVVRQPVRLDELLEELVDSLSFLAERKHIALRYKALAHSIVLAEAEQLARLFKNLIENALQYTPAQGRILVSLEEREQQAIVKIEDTGIGISPENLKHVFDRFWQADPARFHTQNSSGAGLGLAIALAIAHAHGGDITVTSQKDRGSVFAVNLPLHRVH